MIYFLERETYNICCIHRYVYGCLKTLRVKVKRGKMNELEGLMIFGMPSVSLGNSIVSGYFPVTRELPKINRITADKGVPDELKKHPFIEELEKILQITGVIAFESGGKAFLLDYPRYMGNDSYDVMISQVMKILRSLDLEKLKSAE